MIYAFAYFIIETLLFKKFPLLGGGQWEKPATVVAFHGWAKLPHLQVGLAKAWIGTPGMNPDVARSYRTIHKDSRLINAATVILSTFKIRAICALDVP